MPLTSCHFMILESIKIYKHSERRRASLFGGVGVSLSWIQEQIELLLWRSGTKPPEAEGILKI